jgi:hypothetical protein
MHPEDLYIFQLNQLLLKVVIPDTFNDDEHVIPLTNNLPSCVELPLPSIFNKSVPAPFLNIKPSNKGDVDVPQLLKYVFAPLSKYIL